MQAQNELAVIDRFDGDYKFLSNFYVGEPIVYKTQLFMTAEHLYMSLKTDDPMEAAWVASAPTPGEAKRRGQELTLKKNWESLRTGAMRVAVGQKFLQDRQLQKQLLATGGAELIEGNTWHDSYWGVCSCEVQPACLNPGSNNLGKILMELRRDLRRWA